MSLLERQLKAQAAETAREVSPSQVLPDDAPPGSLVPALTVPEPSARAPVQVTVMVMVCGLMLTCPPLSSCTEVPPAFMTRRPDVSSYLPASDDANHLAVNSLRLMISRATVA